MTSHGAYMAEMPVEPRLAKVLITAKHFECTEDVLSAAAMLSVQGPWLQPRMSAQNREALHESMREFAAPEGDHITYVRLYEVIPHHHFVLFVLFVPEFSNPCPPGMAKPARII